jgi:4'-phosphopantetheinyl transferase
VSADTLIRTLARPPGDFAWAWALERPASAPLNVRVLPALRAETNTPPRADELILWFGAPGAGDQPNLRNCLSEDERARASSFRSAADRWAFAAAHAGLRILLGAMLASAPHELRFRIDANGKPCLDHEHHGAAVQFHISHARFCVAIAIAGRPVGIDVERRRALPDLMAVAQAAFAREDCDALAACSEPAAQQSLFYRYWTLSEAFTKATGEGIAHDPASFAFTRQGKPALIRVSAERGPLDRWRFDCEP